MTAAPTEGFDANIAEVFARIAARIPDREAVITPSRRLTFEEVDDRSRRLANALVERGIGCHIERSDLQPHESGQDHVALFMHNGPEYLEGMLGAWRARGVGFNVNYRYVADELRSLLLDADTKAIIFHACFAPTVAEIRDDLAGVRTFIQVEDDSGEALLDSTFDYEEMLAAADPGPDAIPAPDDLYIVYTGGTTGPPKGVLWRQADIWPGAMGGADPRTGEEFTDYEAAVENASQERVFPSLIAAPLMHGAGHWLAFQAWMGGDPVVFGQVVDRLDAADLLRTIERERCAFMIVVGNAFGRPILDELDRALGAGDAYDLSALKVLATGGTAMTTGVKQEFLAHRPGLRIIDSMGSSESGAQGRNVAADGEEIEAGVFDPGAGTCLISEAMDAVVEPTDGATGWLARSGRIPLGYLGDADKTARTFPMIDGVRYSVPGDRAEWRADGRLQLLGRDSVCINTGGEKVFVEEVEAALHSHAMISDAVVVGRPNERWGSEVCAVISSSEPLDADDVIAHCAQHLARYKLPRTVIAVPEIVRGPNGKADYRWAAGLAAREGEQDV